VGVESGEGAMMSRLQIGQSLLRVVSQGVLLLIRVDTQGI